MTDIAAPHVLAGGANISENEFWKPQEPGEGAPWTRRSASGRLVAHPRPGACVAHPVAKAVQVSTRNLAGGRNVTLPTRRPFCFAPYISGVCSGKTAELEVIVPRWWSTSSVLLIALAIVAALLPFLVFYLLNLDWAAANCARSDGRCPAPPFLFPKGGRHARGSLAAPSHPV